MFVCMYVCICMYVLISIDTRTYIDAGIHVHISIKRIHDVKLCRKNLQMQTVDN